MWETVMLCVSSTEEKDKKQNQSGFNPLPPLPHYYLHHPARTHLIRTFISSFFHKFTKARTLKAEIELLGKKKKSKESVKDV